MAAPEGFSDKVALVWKVADKLRGLGIADLASGIGKLARVNVDPRRSRRVRSTA